MPPDRRDLALAGVLTAGALVQALAWPIAPRAVGVALASMVPVAWRWRAPVAAALIGASTWWYPADGYLIVGYVAALLLFYTLAVQVADVRLVAAVTAAGVALRILNALLTAAVLGEAVGATLVVVAPVVVGRLVRRLRDLAWHLDRERERSAHAAVVEERARIARELHDVVGHGVSAIAIQSDAAEAALDQRPELARAPLRAIRGTAADALAEMRRLLAVLRDDGEPGALAPQPRLQELPALIDRSGIPVQLTVEGTPVPVPASVDLSACRIAQEALTNVGKHARGASAHVHVRWAPDAVVVRVTDDGPGPSPVNGHPGHGMVGMNERVRLVGGRLRTGTAPGGGFLLEAELPYAS